jgi:RNA polymerase sigma-70 factor (ECF subfamily)
MSFFFRHKKTSDQKLSGIGDEQLLFHYRETKDPVFLEEVFSRYTHMVFGLCMKILDDEDAAKDQAMQVLERLLNDEVTANIKNLKNFLYRVATNDCLLAQRKQKLFEDFSQEELKKISSGFMEFDDLEHHYNREDLEWRLKMLKNAIRKLSDEQRTCLKLAYLKDKTYQEVASVTGYSMAEVKSHIQNAKRNLKIYFGNK